MSMPPKNIIPVGDTPDGYSPEYLPDGQVWLLKDGKRLRLLRNVHEFTIAAQMHGGFADLHTPLDVWPVLPFAWHGAAPQYDPPAEVPPDYLISFRFRWPIIEVSVSIDHAIWKLWTDAKKSTSAAFIRQCDPVSSWFENWINLDLVFKRGQTRYIRLRDLQSERGRLTSLLKAIR